MVVLSLSVLDKVGETDVDLSLDSGDRSLVPEGDLEDRLTGQATATTIFINHIICINILESTWDFYYAENSKIVDFTWRIK